MATTSTIAAVVGKMKPATQQGIWNYVNGILANHQKFTEFQDKMDIIDMAYARYVDNNKTFKDGNGQDTYKSAAGCVSCGDVFAGDKVTPPIVVAQVDTYVAYLAEVFLSGSPIFPVLSNPSKRKYAEQLETLIDDHSTIGGYARQLLLFFKDGIKYNFSAIETNWTDIEEFSIQGAFENKGRGVNRGTKKYNELKRLNPRNVLRDMTVAIGDIAKLGDYAGYIEYVSKNRCRSEMDRLKTTDEAYNRDLILASVHPDTVAGSNYYRDDPRISDYISQTSLEKNGAVDWNQWWDNVQAGGRKIDNSRRFGAQMERVCLYIRMVPAEFGIPNPNQHVPQIFKVVYYNGIMACCTRIITAYNFLPILFGQPLEDGLGHQTQSVAESEIGFQEAAGTLFNIRFAAARRAVSDRAVYDTEHISAAAINSKAAAPKIPVRLGTLSKKTLKDLYHQIPFDSRGLETVIQDAQIITNFSKELHGGNSPRQGQFQKGNKSVQEWNDTMAGSDNRYRLPAIMLEHQVFTAMKSLMVFNIFLYGDNVAVVSQKSGETLNIDIDELRRQVLSFRVADGLTPKSRLASTEAVTAGLQMLMNSPILQQQLGTRVVPMYLHLMSLMGVKGMEEYDPSYQTPQTAARMPGNLAENAINAPGTIPVAPGVPAAPIPATPVSGTPYQAPAAGPGMAEGL